MPIHQLKVNCQWNFLSTLLVFFKPKSWDLESLTSEEDRTCVSSINLSCNTLNKKVFFLKIPLYEPLENLTKTFICGRSCGTLLHLFPKVVYLRIFIFTDLVRNFPSKKLSYSKQNFGGLSRCKIMRYCMQMRLWCAL